VRPPGELSALFRAQGRKMTPQRQCIFRVLHGNVTHPTAEAIYEAVAAEMPTISRKTVYQTLHDLADLGEVELLDLGTGAVRVDPNSHRAHHHLVCEHCGKVRDVTVDFAGLELPADAEQGFAVHRAEVVFRGRCAACAAAGVPSLIHEP
jgi:Fe2+ or Zn2+ uptake regulation protein